MKNQELINEPDRVDVIGVPISAVNLKIAIDFLYENLDKIRGKYICASNAHTCVLAHDDSEYLKVQSESVLSLPDGKPLAIAGKKKGHHEMEKTTGLHFMQEVFSDNRFKDCKHYFYGNTQDNLEIMINNIKNNYPNVNICGFEPSIFRELDDNDLNKFINNINQSHADFVWIGIGAPIQEKLMNRLLNKTNTIMTGVGGAFNILAGKVNDAPDWMQKSGLEWFYRLIKDPKRLFKRYLVTNSKFIWYSWRGK